MSRDIRTGFVPGKVRLCYECPSCKMHGAKSIDANSERTECQYCGTMIEISSGNYERQKPDPVTPVSGRETKPGVGFGVHLIRVWLVLMIALGFLGLTVGIPNYRHTAIDHPLQPSLFLIATALEWLIITTASAGFAATLRGNRG